MKRAIIIGATSGIGKEVAKGLLLQGWKIGVAGRRKTALDAFHQNMELNADIELNTARTNVDGFIRMVTAAFQYFRQQGNGHLAVISSIAGTKGLGVAPAYSATKRFQNTYIDALEQLSNMQKSNIRFTDIRPGFVSTELLNDGKNYPLLMNVNKVGIHIVRALNHKQRVVTIDWRYAVIVFFWRMIPRWLWKRLPVKTN